MIANKKIEFINNDSNLITNIISEKNVNSSYYGNYDKYYQYNDDIDAEIVLWKNVISQQIIDYTKNGTTKDILVNKHNAENFLFNKKMQKILQIISDFSGIGVNHIRESAIKYKQNKIDIKNLLSQMNSEDKVQYKKILRIEQQKLRNERKKNRQIIC